MGKSNSRNPEGARGGGRRLGPEARREQILAAALPCFARRGYAGAGTRDLARASGISEPILYRHFGGKADLFQAVLARVGDRLVAAVELAMGEARSAGERLKALGAVLPNLLELHGDALRVLTSAASEREEPAIHAAGAECARRVGKALGAAFRGSGLNRGVSAETAGFLLLQVGMGASILHPLDLPEMDPATYTDRAIRALLHGIAR